MKPVEFVGQTHLFGAPQGWDQKRDGICGVLPIRIECAERVPDCISYWKPSREELAALIAGAHVRLSVVGGQPPVWIGVEQIEELP